MGEGRGREDMQGTQRQRETLRLKCVVKGRERRIEGGLVLQKHMQRAETSKGSERDGVGKELSVGKERVETAGMGSRKN